MFNRDVATGKVDTTAGKECGYATKGVASVAHVRNQVPVYPVSECYLWDIFETCTKGQTERLRNGTAVVKDWVVVG
jgi:carboxypeptidase D